MPWQAVAAGIGALGSIFQHNQNRGMTREQMEYQTAEREASQAYQTSEREAQQAYQTSERNAQNAYQEGIYNKYQSPEAMVRQYQAAGLNGKLAVEGAGSLGNMSVSSGNSGGAPSSGAPHGASIAPPYQQGNIFASGFQNMAAAMAALGQAKKTGVETSQMEQLFTEEFRRLKLSNDAQALYNSVNKDFLNKKTAAELEKLLTEVTNGTITSEILRSQLEGLAKDNLIKQNEIDTWYERFNANIRESNSRSDLNDTASALNLSHISYNSVLEYLAHAQASSAFADAGLKKSLTHTQDLVGDLQEIERDIKRSNSEYEKRSLKAEYESLEAECLRNLDDIQAESRSDARNKVFRSIRRGIKTLGRSIKGI